MSVLGGEAWGGVALASVTLMLGAASIIANRDANGAEYRDHMKERVERAGFTAVRNLDADFGNDFSFQEGGITKPRACTGRYEISWGEVSYTGNIVCRSITLTPEPPR